VALLEQQVAQHQRQQYDQLQQDTGDTGRRQGTSAISDDGGGGGGGDGSSNGGPSSPVSRQLSATQAFGGGGGGGGGWRANLKLMRKPKVSSWLCFSSVAWEEEVVDIGLLPDAPDPGAKFKSSRGGGGGGGGGGSSFIPDSSYYGAGRREGGNGGGGGGGGSGRRQKEEEGEASTIVLPSRGTNVLPILKPRPNIALAPASSSPAQVPASVPVAAAGVASTSTAAVRSAPASAAGAAGGSVPERPERPEHTLSFDSNLPRTSGSVVPATSMLSVADEAEVNKRMKLLTMKLAKEKAAEARRKKQATTAAAAAAGSSPPAVDPGSGSAATPAGESSRFDTERNETFAFEFPVEMLDGD